MATAGLHNVEGPSRQRQETKLLSNVACTVHPHPTTSSNFIAKSTAPSLLVLVSSASMMWPRRKLCLPIITSSFHLEDAVVAEAAVVTQAVGPAAAPDATMHQHAEFQLPQQDTHQTSNKPSNHPYRHPPHHSRRIQQEQ